MLISCLFDFVFIFCYNIKILFWGVTNMYVKVQKNGNQWLRDDNGTLVGTTAETYANLFFGGTTPIIESTDGTYIRPVYGRIDSKTKKFIPLCEGYKIKHCTGRFCKGFASPICSNHKSLKSDGYYIFISD